MTHIGDVYTHFPQSFLQRFDRDGIVEVLSITWVNGNGEGVAEVLPLGDLFRRDASVQLIGSSFHFLWIFVRQTKLCEDGVHLCVVITLVAQHIYHLTNRVTSFLRPVDDLHHHFLPILCPFQFFHRDNNVALQDARRHRQKRHTVLHIQGTDKRFLSTLHYFNDFTMQLMVAIFLGMNTYLDTVARQRMVSVFVIDGDAHAIIGIHIVTSS